MCKAADPFTSSCCRSEGGDKVEAILVHAGGEAKVGLSTQMHDSPTLALIYLR